MTRLSRIRLRIEADAIGEDGMRVIYATSDIEPDDSSAPVTHNTQVLVRISEMLAMVDNERRKLADGN